MTPETLPVALLAPLKRGLPLLAHSPTTLEGAPAHLVAAARLIARSSPDGDALVQALAANIAVSTGTPRAKARLTRASVASAQRIARLDHPGALARDLDAALDWMRTALAANAADPAPAYAAVAVERVLKLPPGAKQAHPDAIARALVRADGLSPEAAQELATITARLHAGLHGPAAGSPLDARLRAELPEAIGTHLRAAYHAHTRPRTNGVQALNEPLGRALRALAAGIHGDDEWERACAHFRSARASDGAPVFAAVGSYPFNLAEPRFDQDREHALIGGSNHGAYRTAANAATLAYLQTTAVVVPVFNALNGSIVEHTASARLFAEHVRRDPEGTLAHSVAAAWDADTGSACAFRPEGLMDGWIEAVQGHRPGAQEPQIPLPLPELAERELLDPEHIAITPKARHPVFVFVPPQDLHPITEGENATLYTKPSVAGGNAPQGVHPHALALAVAGRLGGARDVALLTREASQGGLFETHGEYGTGLNLPLHHATIGLLAQGAGAMRTGIHHGAPWAPDQELVRPIPANAGAYVDLVDMPDLRTHFARLRGAKRPFTEPSSAPDQLFAWVDTAARRPGTTKWRYDGTVPTAAARTPARATRPRSEQTRFNSLAERPALRIALLLNPDDPHELRHAIRLFRHAGPRIGSRDHDYLIPRALWGAPHAAETLQEALNTHYPWGRSDARRRRTPPDSGRLHIVDTSELVAEHCDLILIGTLEPHRRSHLTLWNVLARSAHEPIARVLAGPSLLEDNANRAIVWGDANDRHQSWDLRGNMALTQSLAHPNTARLLVAKARHATLDALIVKERFEQIPRVAPSAYGPQAYDADDEAISAAYDPAAEALLKVLERAPPSGRHALEHPPATVPETLRYHSVDSDELLRAPGIPSTTLAHAFVREPPRAARSPAREL